MAFKYVRTTTRLKLGRIIFQHLEGKYNQNVFDAACQFATYPWKYYLSVCPSLPAIQNSEYLFQKNIDSFLNETEKHFRTALISVVGIERRPCLNCHMLISYPGEFDDVFFTRVLTELFGHGSVDDGIRRFNHDEPGAIPYAIKEGDYQTRNLHLIDPPDPSMRPGRSRFTQAMRERFKKNG